MTQAGLFAAEGPAALVEGLIVLSADPEQKPHQLPQLDPRLDWYNWSRATLKGKVSGRGKDVYSYINWLLE